MYRNTNDGQTSIYDFLLPFGGHLKEDNRWVQLRNNIDRGIVDEARFNIDNSFYNHTGMSRQDISAGMSYCFNIMNSNK